MALTVEKQGEIALALIKEKLTRERGMIPDVKAIKREIGNISKKLGFSKEELTEFVLILIKEISEKIISEFENMNKTGASE